MNSLLASYNKAPGSIEPILNIFSVTSEKEIISLSEQFQIPILKL